MRRKTKETRGTQRTRGTRWSGLHLLGGILLLVPTGFAQTPPSSSREPRPWKVAARLPDVVETASPSAVKLEGFLGLRAAHNAQNRLLLVSEEPLLAGFRKRPGSHPWIGEHVGKWLHASTLAWSYTGDDALKAKLDRVVTELVRCQEADGYLGTYVPEQRFGLFPGADWDVWSHKYNLMGLLTYYQFTGNEPALGACRRMGDLLIHTFGPGKKSILSAGTHVGMAATSVLEPIVLLYRATGEERYLEFARYLVRSWDEPGGPAILTTLLREKSVAKTANAKAYEMLSNLVGLCELARATGDRSLLDPAILAWEDVVARRLYLTGSASQGEHFRADHELPNQAGANVAETCVTTTWIQFNSQLLRLTGQARYADQLEKTFVNHLAAAQRPDGAQWCYFTALEGTKPYGPGINCCVSSGPRGMALVPQHAFLRLPGNAGAPDTLIVNLLETARATFNFGQQVVVLDQFVDPAQPAQLTITLNQAAGARFALAVRTPEWARPLQLQIEGTAERGVDQAGWTTLPARVWNDGARVRATFHLGGRLVAGEHGNQGKAALMWGPAVLAYDEAFNQNLGPAAGIGLAVMPSEPVVRLRLGQDLGALFEAYVRTARHPEPQRATFVLFADAGSQGSRYRVWVHAPGTPLPRNDSKFAFAAESRSRSGNVSGSISDGDLSTFVVTFDGRPQTNAWFAVQSSEPVEFRRVLYVHGRVFHDGGWFDASAGKPRVEVQKVKDGPWERVAVLESYPATTATDSAGLAEGQTFEARLSAPVQALALRVVGRPACGDNPAQAFASCAELQAAP